MYSVEISFTRHDQLSLEGVWGDSESAVDYAQLLAELLDGDFRVIVVKNWSGEESNTFGRIDGDNN